MTTEKVVEFFVNDTLKMCGGVLMLVVSYKIYKLKCDAVSDCGWFKFTGSNSGGIVDAGEALADTV